MDEALGLSSKGDIKDGTGNIYSGPLTFDHVHCPVFDFENSTTLTALSFPNLLSMDTSGVNGAFSIQNNSALTSIAAPLLTSLTSIDIEFNALLSSLNLNGLVSPVSFFLRISMRLSSHIFNASTGPN